MTLNYYNGESRFLCFVFNKISRETKKRQNKSCVLKNIVYFCRIEIVTLQNIYKYDNGQTKKSGI